MLMLSTSTTILSEENEENVFTVNEVKVEGAIDLNFSREKYLNKAFRNSFKILMNKILLTRDFKKVTKINLNQIKKLISKFQIVEESYRGDMYKANIKIFYSEKKIKNFLGKKNISFAQPENISAIFFPILYINDDLQSFEENYFYQEWNNIKIKNEVINFILPLEDLEDITSINEMKNKIEKLDVNVLVNKYDVKNYAFVLIDYAAENLNIYLKTNFNNNTISKNISHNLKNINDKEALSVILKSLKVTITDLWKEENLINILMPLSINLKYKHNNLKNLENLKNIFNKINIIDNYILEEFNINNSFFKIYYYGDPKKLRSELLKFGYLLKNNQGHWQLYLNE